VERCQGAACSSFAQIATSASTTYPDTGLTPSTSYSYRVRATDAAGSLSNYSNVASATTASSSGGGTITRCAGPRDHNARGTAGAGRRMNEPKSVSSAVGAEL
jgi:hypothetical protein